MNPGPPQQDERRPWYGWIGPWPFRPLVTLLFSAYFFVVTSTGQLMGLGLANSWLWARNAVFYGIPAAAVMASIIWLGRRWQLRHGVKPASYIFFIALSALVGMSLRATFNIIPLEPFNNVPALSLAVFRLMFMLVLITSIAGVLTDRLRRQVSETERALELVRHQQELVLEADETTRRQVASLLHDRVQAGLVSTCLELQMLATKYSTEDRTAFQSVIERLEALRALDVRSAVRILSPDLRNNDVRTAIEELASQYEPSMGTTVHIDLLLDERRTEGDLELMLATYRIVEQALLNSAIHGKAEHASVTVEDDAAHVSITVKDDGRGPDDVAESGTGFAILDTWCRLFDGDWSLDSGPTGGAVLRARLKVQEPLAP